MLITYNDRLSLSIWTNKPSKGIKKTYTNTAECNFKKKTQQPK